MDGVRPDDSRKAPQNGEETGDEQKDHDGDVNSVIALDLSRLSYKQGSGVKVGLRTEKAIGDIQQGGDCSMASEAAAEVVHLKGEWVLCYLLMQQKKQPCQCLRCTNGGLLLQQPLALVCGLKMKLPLEAKPLQATGCRAI